jgi:hypothetical protein
MQLSCIMVNEALKTGLHTPKPRTWIHWPARNMRKQARTDMAVPALQPAKAQAWRW